MDLNNLASGLLGALVGAIGGSALTIWWQWQDRRDRRRAAGRAVMVELARIGNVAEAVLADNPSERPLTRSAFDASLPELAALLDDDELELVSEPYQRIEAVEKIRQEQNVPRDTRRQLELAWLSRTARLAHSVLTPKVRRKESRVRRVARGIRRTYWGVRDSARRSLRR